jgi:hypothetical protein
MQASRLLLYYNSNNKTNTYYTAGKGVAMTDDGIVSWLGTADDTKITTSSRCGVATEQFRTSAMVTARVGDRSRRNLYARSLLLFVACGIAAHAGGAPAENADASASAGSDA